MHRFHPPLDPRFGDPWWHGYLGWLIPLLVFVVLVGLSVWAVTRLTGSGRLALASSPAPVRRNDSALELVRGRYARGEISRDEFAQLSSDLGAPVPEPPTGTEPG